MTRWFRSRRPQPTPAPEKASGEDTMVAYLNGLTLTEWIALPALAKVDLRESVAYAEPLAS
jgi:hypothetical protein